jgi:hypothetical protein
MSTLTIHPNDAQRARLEDLLTPASADGDFRIERDTGEMPAGYERTGQR